MKRFRHIDPVTSEIELTRGLWATVDTEDLPKLLRHSWSAKSNQTTWYAYGRIGHRMQYMHRLILNYPNDDSDHIDGNGLNNRKSNLCIRSHGENLANNCAKGICKHHRGWMAYITKDYKRYQKRFRTREEALEWRLQKSAELYPNIQRRVR